MLQAMFKCIKQGENRRCNMIFKDIIREERYYCNHLFRLLCYKKETGGKESGLGKILSSINLPLVINEDTISKAEIYTEVTVLRDFYNYTPQKKEFLKKLYMEFLTIICKQLNKELYPTHIDDVLAKLSNKHPKDFARSLKDTMDDSLFYKEFSALFSAKPDFLVVCGEYMIWIEAKFWESFNTEQLKRMQYIADLCSSKLFEQMFNKKKNIIIKLGTDRHKHAKREGNFLNWKKVSEVASTILPNGDDNYSSEAFAILKKLDCGKHE
jgi:hypothetical protein